MNKEDREYIKLQYEKFEKINDYIKSAIEKSDFETIENIFDTKNQLIKQIVNFERIYHEDIKKDKELYNYKMSLIEKEKENIKLIENLKQTTAQELVKTNKIKKIYKTYEPSVDVVHSTIEISDEEQ